MAWAVGRSGVWRRSGRPCRLEHEERALAAAGVVRLVSGPDLDQARPVPIDLLRASLSSVVGRDRMTNLNAGDRVRTEVMCPRAGGIETGVDAADDEPFGVFEVEDRCRVELACAAAGGCQQQHRATPQARRQGPARR